MTTRRFSVKDVEASWLAIDLAPGFAAGSFIRSTKRTENFRDKPDGYGGTVTLFNPDRGGQVAITLDRESGVHFRLMVISESDFQLKSFSGPLVVFDTFSKETTFFNKAKLVGTPNFEKGSTSSVVTWVWNFGALIQVPPREGANVVG